MIKEKISKTYPSLFEDDLLNEFENLGELIDFKVNDILIDLNQTIKSMPILLSGAIKILREDYEDGELLLYFLEKGDTCAMTMSCCLGDKQSKIRAVAETDGQMVMIPIGRMDQWLANYPSWRQFIFDSYNNRMEEMLAAIDNLAFNDMNQRLKKYLLDVASINKGKVINKTHQEIAYELNTSRVVISRLLKALEKESFLQLNRNVITIL